MGRNGGREVRTVLTLNPSSRSERKWEDGYDLISQSEPVPFPYRYRLGSTHDAIQKQILMIVSSA